MNASAPVTFSPLAAAIIAELPNPAEYASNLVAAERDIATRNASQYGAAQVAVRAGRDYFATVTATLSAIRASDADTVRAVYKRLHAACVANNAPFIIQSRKAGLSVIDRTPTVETAPTDETAPKATDETKPGAVSELAPDVAERIRALESALAEAIAERDAARAELAHVRAVAETLTSERNAIVRERDAARAELAKLAKPTAKRSSKRAAA